MEPREKGLAQAALPAVGQRLPAVVEAHVDTAAEGVNVGLVRQREIELKNLFDRFEAFLVERIDGDRAAALASQGGARQFFAGGGDAALTCRGGRFGRGGGP